MSGFLQSKRQAKTLGGDIILRAIKKTTRAITQLVSERVLPWYKGGR